MPVDDEDDWAEERRILSKYDDDATIEAERKKKSRIVIGQTDGQTSGKEGKMSKRPTDSLETKKTVGSDYFTEQEVGPFRKPVLFGKKRREPEGGDIVAELEKTAVGETFLATKRARKEATAQEDLQQA